MRAGSLFLKASHEDARISMHHPMTPHFIKSLHNFFIEIRVRITSIFMQTVL